MTTLAEELLALSQDTAMSAGPLEESGEITFRLSGSDMHIGSPYDPEIVPKLGKNGLGGKWQKKAKEWRFPIRDYVEVAKVYDEHYGSHGASDSAKASLAVTLGEYEKAAAAIPALPMPVVDRGGEVAIEVAGITLATMSKIDGDHPVPAPGVTIENGGFERGQDSSGEPTIELKFATIVVAADIAPLKELTLRMSGLLRQAGRADTGIKLLGASKTPVAGSGAGGSGTGASAASAQAPVTASPDEADGLEPALREKLAEFDKLLTAVAGHYAAETLPRALIDNLLRENGLVRTK